MEKRIAIISVVAHENADTEKINNLLHEYSQHIVGRMGIPYEKRSIALISVVLDAPGDIINSLSGKLGKLQDVTSKTLYAKVNS